MPNEFKQFLFYFLLGIFLSTNNSASLSNELPNATIEDTTELDASIKIFVEPLLRSAVVDRVTGPATIFVKASNIKSVQVYMEAVDAPYGGKSLAEPKLIGKSNEAKKNFPISWNSVESYPYVKLFAVCSEKGSINKKRSEALDLALAGPRLKLENKQELQAH